jgi:hypothetical protein
MKAYRGRRSIAPLVLNVCIRLRWVGIFALWLLYPQGRTWYLLNRRLGGPQCQSGYFRDEKNSLPLLGFEPQIVQSLYWLWYHGTPFWIFFLIHHRSKNGGRGVGHVESTALKVNTCSSLSETKWVPSFTTLYTVFTWIAFSHCCICHSLYGCAWFIVKSV